MSAFVKTELDIDDQAHLIGALKDLGWTDDQIEVHEDAVPLVGYHGDKRAQKAHVIVRRKHIGGSSNDVGFERVDGKFIAHVSEYDRNSAWASRNGCKNMAHWEGRLKQLYGVRRAEAVAKKQGFKVTKTQEKGKVQLVLQRWR